MADFQPFDAASHPIIRCEDDWNNLLAHGLEKIASYIVRINGSYYEAIKGGTSSGAGTIAYGGANNAGAIDGTDAAAVIQAAIDVLTSGGYIFIKRGTYPIGTRIDHKENVWVYGEGIDVTILEDSAALDEMWKQSNASNTFLGGLTLEGNKTANKVLVVVREGAAGVIKDITFDSIKVRGTAAAGNWMVIFWDTLSEWNLQNITLKNSIIEDYAPLKDAADNVAFSYLDGIKVLNTTFRDLGYTIFGFYTSKNGYYDNVTFDSNSNADFVISGHNFVGKNLIFKDGEGFTIRCPEATLDETKNIQVSGVWSNITGTAIEISDSATRSTEDVQVDAIIDTTDDYGISIGGSTTGVKNVELNVWIHDCDKTGIYVNASGAKTKISGYIFNNSQAGAGAHPAIVNHGDDTQIVNAYIYDDQGAATQTKAITNEAGNILLWTGGLITGTVTINAGTIDKIRHVAGYITENSGITGAIATGTAVNHGLAGTPTSVTVTSAEAGPTDVYVDTVGAASFKINFGGGGNKTFYWTAEYAP